MKYQSTSVSRTLLFAWLAIVARAGAQTWTSDANGTWSDPLNWLGGSPPDAVGAIADFSTLDIAANRIVTLDSARTIGQLKFGDVTGNQNWTLATNGISDVMLTLETAAGTPVINVVNNGATNRLALSGSQGLAKLGSGWLTLQGPTNVYGGVTVASNGTLFLAKAAGVTAIPGDLDIYSGATVQLVASNQIADTSTVTIHSGGTLNLANRPESIFRLILEGGIVTNTSGSPQLQVTNGFELRSGEVHSILAGAGQVLVKTGPGTVLLNAANTYSGGTVIQEGTLRIGDGGTSGTPGAAGSAITNHAQLVLDRGSGSTLSISGIISGSGSITKTGSGAVTLGGVNTYSGSTILSNGLLNLSASSTLGDGTGVLILAGGTLNTTANRPAATAPVPNPIQIIADSEITTASSSGTVDLNFTGSVTGAGGTLTFRNDGANAPTDLFDPRFSAGFELNRPIVIDNGAVGLTRLNAFNSVGTTQIFNGPISGNGSFRKGIASGAGGPTVFNGTNSYLGTTTINAGELWVNGSLGTNTVTVGSGATLGGTGLIDGAVLVQSGGTVAPGWPAGTLTISNTLTLTAGSKIVIDLKSGGPSDRIAGLTAVSFGGALQLDIAGTLVGGDSFQIFQAGSYSGGFSSIVPATPGSGLEWNTNSLLVNGTLAVLSTNTVIPPTLTNIMRMVDRNVQFAISGTAGHSYRVWAATNLASGNWTLLTNGTFASSAVDFVDSEATNHLQRFYRVTIP